MPIKAVLKAEYLISSKELAGCPSPDKPEYAFLGRSNVGKSSLLNMLTGRRAMARTSSTPGKTRLINHFLIEDEWYMVDLPGFGYAKSSRSNREEWEKMIRAYLLGRENLMCHFYLVDARLEPQEIDLEWISFHGENNLPFAIVFTKTDKLSPPKLQSGLERYRQRLLQDWEELPPIFLSSAVKSTGREELLEFIFKANALFEKS